jgi:hypothetical protein
MTGKPAPLFNRLVPNVSATGIPSVGRWQIASGGRFPLHFFIVSRPPPMTSAKPDDR